MLGISVLWLSHASAFTATFPYGLCNYNILTVFPNALFGFRHIRDRVLNQSTGFCGLDGQARQRFRRRLKYGFNSYGAEAIGLIEKTVVQARPTPEAGLNDNPMVLTERTKPSRFTGSEYGHDRHF